MPNLGPSLEDLMPSKNKPDEDSTAGKLSSKIDEITLGNKEEEVKGKAQMAGLAYFNLVGFPISPDALTTVDREESKKNKVICFFNNGQEIRLGAVEYNGQAKIIEKQIKESHHANVSTYLISENSFKTAWKLYESLPKFREASRGVEITAEDLENFGQDITDFRELNAKIQKTSVTNLVALILSAAIKGRASDIHIEAEEKNIHVRYRIDGVLNDVAVIDKTTWPKIISRIKQLAKLKINISNKPQDGRFSIFTPKDRIDVRVSALPTAFGESVVMRILLSSSINLSFDELGLTGEAYKTLEREISRPNGMIITTGPTGSGKTTTLYAILTKLNDPETKIITTGPVFLLNAGKLYTKPTATSQVEIFSMYNNYQTINIKGDKHDYQIEIDSQNINKWNNIVIAPDDYHIESNGGQKINGLNFSVSQESYFNPFIFRLQEKPESKKENLPADIIITKYEITNDQDGWTKVSQQYNQDVIMANGGYESINFRLTSAKIGASYWTKSNLENNGLELRNNLGNYNLWAKPEMPELVDKDLPVINNNQELISFLDKTLPKNTHKVIASSANIKDLDYINKEKPNGFNNQDKSYPISLRGEHTFFIYLKNKLDLSFIKEDLDLYSGLDSIEMTLTNWLGEKVCSKRFIDSENKKENLITFSCPNIETGPYILDILELLSGNKKYNDFLIRNLKVNTNKLMIKDRVLTMKPIKLITNYTQNQEISFYYWHKNKNQEIIINNNETNDRINLTKEDMGKYVPYTLSDGKSIIEITIGDLYIRNNKSALDEDSWFEATHDIIINSRVNQNTEYAAIPIEENKNTILKKLEIEIK